MNYLSFRQRLSSFRIFSSKDIEMLIPGFNKMNLVNWQKKNYITKLRNGFYMFSGAPENELELFSIACKIYQPSYVSLETALNYYGLIPEGVFAVQSITTLKTSSFSNSTGVYTYHNIKESAFSGYKLVPGLQGAIKIASPGKAVLDWIYLRADIGAKEDFAHYRLNAIVLNELVDMESMETLGRLFGSKEIMRSICFLKGYMNDFT
jgi:predicted transcriptional regulator of viral defense system